MGSYDACMPSTTYNLWNLFIKLQNPWNVQVLLILVAKLTIISITPSINFSFISLESWMFLSAREINHLWYFMGKLNLYWLIYLVSVGANHSKLSISVGTPRVKFSIFVHAHCIINTAINLDNVAQSFNLHWRFYLVPVIMPKSSIFAKAPGVDFSIFSHTCGMLETASYFYYFLIFQLS